MKLCNATRIACLVLLGVHFSLSFVYSLVTPLWEPPDEIGHYTYARYIATHGALPVLGTKISEYNEAHQPPLYYALVALAIAGIDTSDDVQPKFTPLAMWIGGIHFELDLNPSGDIMAAPDSQHDVFPYRGTALAVHVGRLVSVLLSTLAVWLTYLSARTLLPGRPNLALLATAIHALWPQFLFMGAAINNDVMVALFGSLTLWLLARLVMRNARRRRLSYLGLAACLAGATLSKDSAAALLLFGGVIVFGLTLRDVATRQWRQVIDLAFLVIPLAVLILAGAWVSGGRSVRQLDTAADLMATSVNQVVPGIAESPQGSLGITGILQELPRILWYGTLPSFFGVFGGGFIYLPDIWYDLARLCAVICAAGVLLALTRREWRLPIFIPLLCLLFVVAAPLARTIAGNNLNLLAGRFFLPALSACAILMAIGLSAFPSPLYRLAATFTLAGVALAGLLSPSIAMAPIYRQPALLDPVAPPSSMQVAAPITFGDAIQLLGYSQPISKAVQGGSGQIEVYWRALKPIAKDYILRVDTFGTDGQSFRERLDMYPGNNTFPTSLWQPGDTFADLIKLPVKPDVPAPSLATFRLNWIDPDTGQPLTPACADGATCEPKVGAVPVMLSAENAAAWAGQPARYRLGQQVELLDVALPAAAPSGQALTVTLVWRATASGLPSLTTFLHILSADGKLVAQTDAPPRGGNYPTSVWSAGEIIPDQYTVPLDPALPPGTYHVRLGMYDARTVERLPAFDAAGTPLQDNVIPLTDITVR
ncbi:MAG: glycosyltransferase family 39 protein [Chloroflexi bacterium]|nr:glycosyltransferase family 39 protein [Chloroflexota bacterium]